MTTTPSAQPQETIRELIAEIRAMAKEFKHRSEKLRRDAQDANIRASELYDAFISMDMIADKFERDNNVE